MITWDFEYNLNKYISTEFDLENAHIVFVLDYSFIAPPDIFTKFQHQHSKCEFFFVKQGECTVYVENETYHIAKNNFIVIPAELNHNIIPAQNTRIFPVKLQFYKNNKKSNEIHYDVFSILNSIICRNNKPGIFYSGVKIFEKIDDLVTALQTQKFLYHEFLNAAAKQLTIHIAECMSNVYFNDLYNGRQNANNKNKPVYSDIIEGYFGNLYSDQLSLSGLSKHLCISESHARRLIKQIYDMSFVEILTKMRINAAKKMIEETDLSLETIAENVGYNSYNGFLHAFKKLTGKNPSEFKNYKE